ncbi:MAG: RsmD family RNA methyltransferase, partial [Rhodospirillaceae bacterium]|nr:RsmD family RNA methyltransferase [Rhodospirillaceae bacterium]
MRINAGKHKGRQLVAPKGKTTRPTSDMAREAIFNVLAHGVAGPQLIGARIADIFAGTGAIGLEALSRGADFAAFVETAPAALKALVENIENL